MDVLGGYLDERVRPAPGAKIAFPTLFEDYIKWSTANTKTRWGIAASVTS
jgi:hypothetical protein